MLVTLLVFHRYMKSYTYIMKTFLLTEVANVLMPVRKCSLAVVLLCPWDDLIDGCEEEKKKERKKGEDGRGVSGKFVRRRREIPNMYSTVPVTYA